MNIGKMAIRNVIRHWHRTLVTTLAMAFAGFIMILFATLMEGMLKTSERNAVIMDVGDFQIHAKGYRDDPDLYKRIEDSDTLLEKLTKAGYYASPRLYGFALAASGSTSAGVQMRGFSVDQEKKVTQIHKHVMKGEWLNENDPHGVVIGKKLAKTLGIDIGSEIVIVGQASDGSMANDLYKVLGILKSVGNGIDRSGFFMTDKAFRELMVINSGAHEIVVMRPGRQGDLAKATIEIQNLAPKYEVLNWRSLQPILARLLDLASSQMMVMIIITYIAVAMVVLNAMLMGVFERIHEFGIMKAIGVTPWQITNLVIIETMIQTFMASFLALTTGWYAANYFQQYGIDLSNLASSATVAGIAFDPVWHAHVTTSALLTPIYFLFVMALLAVIYPAAKAAMIVPVKAIYYR